jgi:phage shock protein PspC (stress-responsive transcriptional regulator)
MADFTAIWMAIGLIVGSIGAFFITLGKGSGSMIDLLYKDTGLLMKTIPVNSLKLIGGKIIIGLLEFFIYTTLFSVYLCILTLYAKNNSTEFIKISLSDSIFDCFSLFCFAITLFILAQTVLNFAFTLSKSFVKNTKWSGIIVAVTIYFILSFIVEITSATFDIIHFNFPDDFVNFWILIILFTIISIVLYIITSILYDKKVNL